MSDIINYFLNNTAQLIEQAEEVENAHGFFSEFRARALKSYTRLGFPTKALEDWKYTNVSPWLKKLDDLLGIEEQLSVGLKPLEADFETIDLVVKNGKKMILMAHRELPAGLRTMSFEQAIKEEHPAFRDYFGTLTNLDDHFSAANSALFEDGVFIYAEPGLHLDRPLQILNTMAENQSGFSALRILIVIGANAKVSIIESFTDSASGSYNFTSSLNELVICQGAEVDHYVLNQRSQYCAGVYNLEAKVQQGAVYHNFNFSFSDSPFLRNTMHIIMDGKQALTRLSGLYYACGNEVVDNHTCIEHRYSDCNSDQKYKGLVSGTATGVFNGKVIVHPDAQRTNAYQQNNNLILDDNANIYSKPELEIFADDVKCSHGATLGTLDDSAIFYLRSRGITEKKAEQILTEAFAQDIINTVPQSNIQKYIGQLFKRHQQAPALV